MSKKLIGFFKINQLITNPRQKMSSYKLSSEWRDRVDDVRSGRITSQTPSVIWTNGSKHGMEEGSVSRDIIAFVSRQPGEASTSAVIAASLPTAFRTGNKIPFEYVKEFLRELVKMGVLEKVYA